MPKVHRQQFFVGIASNRLGGRVDVTQAAALVEQKGASGSLGDNSKAGFALLQRFFCLLAIGNILKYKPNTLIRQGKGFGGIYRFWQDGISVANLS